MRIVDAICYYYYKEVMFYFIKCIQTPRANVDMLLKAAAVVIADLATKQWLTHAAV